jgi:hypothetical protein
MWIVRHTFSSFFGKGVDGLAVTCNGRIDFQLGNSNQTAIDKAQVHNTTVLQFKIEQAYHVRAFDEERYSTGVGEINFSLHLLV